MSSRIWYILIECVVKGYHLLLGFNCHQHAQSKCAGSLQWNNCRLLHTCQTSVFRPEALAASASAACYYSQLACYSKTFWLGCVMAGETFFLERKSVAVARPSTLSKLQMTAQAMNLRCHCFTELKKFKRCGQERKMGSNNLKFSLNSFPFIENKGNLLSITFIAEIKTKQEKSITVMKIDN